VAPCCLDNASKQADKTTVDGSCKATRRHAYLCQLNCGGINGACADGPGAVGCVTHQSVQDGPCWTKDVRGRFERGLFERHVHVLRVLGWSTCQSCAFQGVVACLVCYCMYIRRVEYPMAVPKATGNRIDVAAFSNTNRGSVMDGM